MKLKNPVFTASGIAGFAEEYAPIVDFNRLGGFITKTVTLKPRKGNIHRRLFEVRGGMINSIGLENPGIESFITKKLPVMKKLLKIPIVVSIAGGNPFDYAAVAGHFNRSSGIGALEVNLSCPNTGRDVLPCQDVSQTTKIISMVKRTSGIPVIAKISPAVADVVLIAHTAKDSGADAVSLINTFPAMLVENGEILSGGFSGPSLKPVALRMIREVAENDDIQIMGIGGITSAADAREFLNAGADCIAVGSAMFRDPLLPIKIVDGLKGYSHCEGTKSPKQSHIFWRENA